MNIIITGASSGLGRELAGTLFDSRQNTIIALGCEKLKQQVYKFIHCDLSMSTHIQTAVNNIHQDKNLRSIDAVVNCAGVNVLNWIEDLTFYDWDYVMEVNARAPFLLVHNLLRRKMLKKGSVVINIISDAARVPMTCSLAYNASKAALEMMTRQMARELTRRHGIYVFGVAPGKIASTRMTKYVDARVPELRGWSPEKTEAYHRASKLYKQDIPPSLLAKFIAQLIQQCEHHPYLTGTIINYGA